MSTRILIGDCRKSMQTLDAGSVQVCVTSPPYFGLRDYGHAGQIGLEPTPEAYVAQLVEVLREVRRVLRDDGTLWLNLGDSFNSGGGTVGGGKHSTVKGKTREPNHRETLACLKPKDLIGIPWRVAFALQQPYYAGKIRDERDRIWLAAMLDAEGCIYIHRRKEGQENGQGYQRRADSFGVGLEIANTHEAIIDRCVALTGIGSVIRQEKDRRQPLFRWTVRTQEARLMLRELYPHLVAKQRQARIGFGCPSSGERATAAWEALKTMHAGSEATVDFPPPPSMFEPGYYLRSDIIWSKSNPMPESVTDRPTKSHEYLFLLSKSPRYYYDADAIAEPLTVSSIARLSQPNLENQAGSDRVPGKTNGNMKAVAPRFGGSKYGDNDEPEHRTKSGDVWTNVTGKRNARTVWTIATQPFKGSHFATFPPALIEPCIMAGSKRGDTVLDPFGGAGTTGLVADRLGRNAVLCELNPAYAALASDRIAADSPLFAAVECA